MLPIQLRTLNATKQNSVSHENKNISRSIEVNTLPVTKYKQKIQHNNHSRDNNSIKSCTDISPNEDEASTNTETIIIG